MRNGKLALATLALIAFLTGCSKPPDRNPPDSQSGQLTFPIDTPIVIELFESNGIDGWRINGKSLSLHDGANRLESFGNTYGKDEPVIVTFGRDVPVGYVADVIEIARESHPNVYSYLRGFQIDKPVISVSTGTVPDLKSLLPYIKVSQGLRSEHFLSSQDSEGLYTSPPPQLLQLPVGKPGQ